MKQIREVPVSIVLKSASHTHFHICLPDVIVHFNVHG